MSEEQNQVASPAGAMAVQGLSGLTSGPTVDPPVASGEPPRTEPGAAPPADGSKPAETGSPSASVRTAPVGRLHIEPGQGSGPGADGPKSPGAGHLHIDIVGIPFRYDPTLDSLLTPCMEEPALWSALQEAIAPCLPEPGATSGIVLAEDPLIGLATVAALGGAIRVPMRSLDERPTGIAGLGEFLKREMTLRSWQSSLQGIDRTGKTFLMRAWGAGISQGAISQELAQPDPSRPNVVCLVERREREQSDDAHILADTSDLTQEILIGVIKILGVPKTPPPEWEQPAKLIPALLKKPNITGARILRSLNSTGHSDFQTLVWQHLGKESGGGKFRDLILYKDENTPRHAASLFVASHFPKLTPDTFLELADWLAARTPSFIPGRNDGRLPDQITDSVRAHCHIRFNPGGKQKKRIAHIGSPDGDLPLKEPAALVKSLFSDEAPLLVERYLLALAHRLTLGHPSDDLIEAYQEMEIDALRALGPDEKRERLRRVVFGYPAVASAEHGFRDANRRALDAAMLRATRRTPAFLDSLFRRGPAEQVPVDRESSAELASPDRESSTFSLTDAVAALCTALPVDSDKTWEDEFDRTAARLFWYAYAANPAGVTIAAFPPLFDKGDNMRPDERQRRRQALLKRFQECLDLQTDGDRADQWTTRLREPQTLTHVISDMAGRFPQMVQNEKEPFAANLFGEATCQYLIRAVRKYPWNSVQAWAMDAEPVSSWARGLLAKEFRTWLDPRKRCAGPTAEHDHGPDVTAGGYTAWLLALGAIDGLVGSALFGDDLEVGAVTAFMFDDKPDEEGVDDHLREAVAERTFNHRWIWEWLCDPDSDHSEGGHPDHGRSPDDAKLARFRTSASSLWRAIPVLLLMAASRVPLKDTLEFKISDATRRFLTATAPGAGEAPLVEVLADIKALQEFQRDFRKVLEKWQAPARPREDWRRALRDREAALAAFRQAIEPLRRHLHAGPARPDAA
jgi:hypothetical protein